MFYASGWSLLHEGGGDASVRRGQGSKTPLEYRVLYPEVHEARENAHLDYSFVLYVQEFSPVCIKYSQIGQAGEQYPPFHRMWYQKNVPQRCP